MSIAAYSEIENDDQVMARQRERELFNRAIDLLNASAAAPADSLMASKAKTFSTRLWQALISDLNDPKNSLPQEIRANLVSIGLWALREIESDWAKAPDTLNQLILVSTSIRDGLACQEG
jgi:flagellar protein FlaF